LIVDHYRGESQTLTTGAEANFLKFKELIGTQSPEEKARWEEIKRTFKRNHREPAAPAAVTEFNDGLKSLGGDLTRAISAVHTGTMAQKVDSLSHELEMIHSTLASLKHLASQRLDHLRGAQARLAARVQEGTVAIELTQEMLTNERAFLEQFDTAFAHRRPTPKPPSP
jgi:uncharacterized protein YdhG (YjbR/CyaY superfamily)